jgi:putative transcriptional regulator
MRCLEKQVRITISEIAEQTGLNRSTLSKVAGVPGYNCTTDVIDKLCKYFGCQVSDLMEHISE